MIESSPFIEDGRTLHWETTEDGGARLIGGSTETVLSAADVAAIREITSAGVVPADTGADNK